MKKSLFGIISRKGTFYFIDFLINRCIYDFIIFFIYWKIRSPDQEESENVARKAINKVKSEEIQDHFGDKLQDQLDKDFRFYNIPKMKDEPGLQPWKRRQPQ